MTTAAKGGRTLSKPRKALVIVEAAALASAVVLLGWLALWLIHQHARALRVEAFYSASDRAPFEEVDARALVGSQGRPAGFGNPDALLPAVLEACRRPGAPVVVSVSDPSADAEALVSLVKAVASEAECDVLLAVDAAQVDSDRELDVYANAPYHGLAESVREIKSGEHVVYVMTSAAPAQKSWESEALGRSVFAFFLQQGLAGDARGWDESDVPGRIGVEGLHRYVRDHVAQWALIHREAVQTPMLLRVGDSDRPMSLAFVRQPAQPAGAQAVEEPARDAPAAAKKEDGPKKEGDSAVAKTSPPPDPRAALLDQLLAEWRSHEALLERFPYRAHPAAFRIYQGKLLKAERRLRNSWAGGASLEPARDELKAATRAREQLVGALDAESRSPGSSPFRPARSEDEGRIELTEALTFLTGSGPEEGLYAVRPPAPASFGPEKKDGEKSVPPPGSARPTDPPDALTRATVRGVPDRYLEMQLPAWGLQFVQSFKVPNYFQTERRGAILRRLVEARARAEDALAVDARGLDWVRPTIEKGDDERRRLQDQLFSPGATAGEAGRTILESVSPVRDAYEKSLRFMRVYQEGRAAWERIAAELPDLAEYAVRAQEREHDAFRADRPIPLEAERALDAAEALVLALDRPVPPEGASPQVVQERLAAIQAAEQNARNAIETLEKAAARDPGRDWTMIDAALRTPWIPTEVRRGLLRVVMGASEPIDVQPGSVASSADASPADPNFWALAGGLARLDERLREIAAGVSNQPADDLVARALNAVKGSVPDALKAFQSYPAKRLRVEFSQRRRGESRRSRDSQGPFQADERAVRLASRGVIEVDDAGVSDWKDLATSRLLGFQAERLQEDYVPAAPELVREAARLAGKVGVEEPRDPFTSSLALTLRTEPPIHSPLRIDDRGKAELEIGLARPEDEAQADHTPAGRAFVGVAAPPAGLSVTAESVGPPFGALVAVPFVGGPRTRLVVHQVDPSAGGAFELAASVFYRGRIDERAKALVDVVPHKSPDPYVRIAYDPEALKRIYAELGPALISRIEDQFRIHPNEGYMHRGKSATYRLHFTNPTFQDVAVLYKRTLVSPGGGEPLPVDDGEKTLRIPAGGSASVSGEVSSDQTPVEKPRDLLVEWRIDDKKPMNPLKVPFRQVEASRYMKFTPSIGIPVTEPSRGECYVVLVKRDPDDRVCEPILGREVSVTIDGRSTRPDSLFPIMRGTAFESMSDRESGKTSFKWSAVVANDSFPTVEFNAR